MKKIFSFLFAIVFIFSIVSLFSHKILAVTYSTTSTPECLIDSSASNKSLYADALWACNHDSTVTNCTGSISCNTPCPRATGDDPCGGDTTKYYCNCTTTITVAPPPPTGMRLPSSACIALNSANAQFVWDRGPTGISYYHMSYQQDGGSFTRAQLSNGGGYNIPVANPYYIASLTPGKYTRWWVQACDANNNCSSSPDGPAFTTAANCVCNSGIEKTCSSNQPQICNSNGTGWDDNGNSCGSNQTCSGGNCADVGPTCAMGGGSFCGGHKVDHADSNTLYWCTNAGSVPKYSYSCGSGGCNPNGEDGNAYCTGKYLCTGGIDSSWNFCGSNGKNQNIITSNAIDSTLYNCTSSTNNSYTTATGQACPSGCSSNALGDGTCNSAPDSGNPGGGNQGGDSPSCTVTWTGTPATVSQGSSFKVIVVPGTGAGWTNEKLYLDGTQVTSNATWAKYPDPQTGPDDSWTFSNPGVVGNHTLKFNNGTTDCTSPFNYTVNAATPISLTVGLDGVGKTGDLANKNPLADADIVAPVVTTPRTVHVDVLDSSGAVKGSGDGTISYQSSGASKGLFTGDVGIPALTPGTYSVKVKVEEHISNTLPNQTITATGPNIITTIPNAEAGDVAWNTGTVPDDQLTASDYAAIMSCMPITFSTADKTACTADLLKKDDLNLDGQVDQSDYNLFLREMNTRKNGSS